MKIEREYKKKIEYVRVTRYEYLQNKLQISCTVVVQCMETTHARKPLQHSVKVHILRTQYIIFHILHIMSTSMLF